MQAGSVEWRWNVNGVPPAKLTSSRGSTTACASSCSSAKSSCASTSTSAPCRWGPVHPHHGHAHTRAGAALKEIEGEESAMHTSEGDTMHGRSRALRQATFTAVKDSFDNPPALRENALDPYLSIGRWRLGWKDLCSMLQVCLVQWLDS
ncbi:hypothetical protein HWV62_28184 [Athelia sp. TMB]|nr:hypothetical protein HWV62_28184 [Athelia sp. TMB]